MSEPNRFEKGVAIVTKLFGSAAGRTKLSEDFRRITIENLFGDIWSRPGLELQERSMITLTTLIVLGREAELRLHLRGARNLGIPRAKIEEILIHLAGRSPRAAFACSMKSSPPWTPKPRKARSWRMHERQ